MAITKQTKSDKAIRYKGLTGSQETKNPVNATAPTGFWLRQTGAFLNRPRENIGRG
jgi:hypothetical protein